MPSYFSILIVIVLACGALAFGAVYFSGYTPLFWAAAAVAAIMVVAGLQLISLTPGQLSTISPAADRG